jgi:ABC-2 type transport system permease protein
MRGAFAAQWVLLRRPRFLIGTIAAVCGVAALGTVLTIIAVGGRDVGGTLVTRAGLARPDGLVHGVEAVGGLLGVVGLAVVAASLSGEYGHGTLRNVLMAQPRRLVWLAGTFLALGSFIIMTVAAATLVGAGLSLAVAPAKGVDISAWLSTAGLEALGKTALNLAVSSLGYGLLGALFAMVLRSPAATISIGLAYALPVEGLLARVWTPSERWLPAQLLDNLASGGDGYSMAYGSAGLRLLAYGAVALAVTTVLFRNRDVTA